LFRHDDPNVNHVDSSIVNAIVRVDQWTVKKIRP